MKLEIAQACKHTCKDTCRSAAAQGSLWVQDGPDWGDSSLGLVWTGTLCHCPKMQRAKKKKTNRLPPMVYIPKSSKTAQTHGAKRQEVVNLWHERNISPQRRAQGLTPPPPRRIQVRTQEVKFRERRGRETAAPHEKDELPTAFAFPTTPRWPS